MKGLFKRKGCRQPCACFPLKFSQISFLCVRPTKSTTITASHLLAIQYLGRFRGCVESDDTFVSRRWVHIPTVCLNHEYKSGFFKLLRTVTELSFPHDIELCLRGTTAKEFEEILPHVHLLVVHVDIPMIKAPEVCNNTFYPESFCRTTDSRLLNSSHFPHLVLPPPVEPSNRLCVSEIGSFSLAESDNIPWRPLFSFAEFSSQLHCYKRPPSTSPRIRSQRALHRPPISAMSIFIFYSRKHPLPFLCPFPTSPPTRIPGLKDMHVEHHNLSPEHFLSYGPHVALW